MGLRQALIRFGGTQRWAEHFGMPISNFQGPHRTWTDERIEAALRELIASRNEWPRRRDFAPPASTAATPPCSEATASRPGQRASA
jgi:hypothetical protein